ncbi:MAG TPA: HAD-IIA family hydrolase [Candidatus Dormibacteraeota bacterium]|nr:HAD-IIA family hydrolase [Candidatus Dormibacteraeota bacterium]
MTVTPDDPAVTPDPGAARVDPASIADDPAALRQRLAGVRALVLDADGVLTLKGRPIDGSAEAIERLLGRGIPFRVVTNFSSMHRETLAARFTEGGLPIPAGSIVTAASAAAAYVRARHPDSFVLGQPDALREFEGIRLGTAAEVDAGAAASAVVVGDAGDDLTFRDLDRAFGLVRRGAELVAMHRNPWWLTPRGETLDSGALVAALEYAAERKAVVAGKPAPTVFRVALAAIAGDLGHRPARGEVGMVGDDLLSDVRAGQRAGLRGILVLTGKHGRADVERLGQGPRGIRADAIAPSLAAVVAALD